MNSLALNKKFATAVGRKVTLKAMQNARPATTTFGLEPPITSKQDQRGEERANAKEEKAKGGAEEKLKAKGAKEMPNLQAKKAKSPANISTGEMVIVDLETGVTTVMK